MNVLKKQLVLIFSCLLGFDLCFAPLGKTEDEVKILQVKEGLTNRIGELNASIVKLQVEQVSLSSAHNAAITALMTSADKETEEAKKAALERLESEYKAKKATTEEEIKNLQGSLRKAKQEITNEKTTCDRRLTEKQQELKRDQEAALAAATASHNAEKQTLKAKQAANDLAIADLERKVAEADNLVQAAQADLSAAQTDVASEVAKAKADAVATATAAKEVAVKALADKGEALKAEQAAAQAQADALTTETSNLNKKVAEEQEKLKTAQKTAAEHKQRMEHILELKAQELAAAQQELSQQKSESAKKLEEANKALEEAELSGQKAAIDAAKEARDKAKVEADQKEAEAKAKLEQLKQENEQLKTKQQEELAEAEKLEKELKQKVDDALKAKPQAAKPLSMFEQLQKTIGAKTVAATIGSLFVVFGLVVLRNRSLKRKVVDVVLDDSTNNNVPVVKKRRF